MVLCSAYLNTHLNAERDSCGVTDFQETLRGIDDAISKNDKTVVDLKSNGHTSFLGQAEAHKTLTMLGNKGRALSEDEEMLPAKSPQGNDFKARGWKRLVSDRPHAEVQTTPMQRKRVVRDEEDEMEVGVLKKKFCSFDTTQKQTAEAAGQPRREQ